MTHVPGGLGRSGTEGRPPSTLRLAGVVARPVHLEKTGRTLGMAKVYEGDELATRVFEIVMVGVGAAIIAMLMIGL